MPRIGVSLYFEGYYAKIVKDIGAGDVETDVVVHWDDEETFRHIASRLPANRVVSVNRVSELPVETMPSNKNATIVGGVTVDRDAARCRGGKDRVY